MIGCDIIEIERIKRSYQSFGYKFAERILSKEELEIFEKRSNKVEFLAGRFSAKESIAKTLRTGIRENLTFKSISVVPDKKGALNVYINNKLRGDVQVSISHCKMYAMAVSIIVDNE